MSKIKKLLALTLALAMVLSVSAFAGYKADTYADADKIDPDCEEAVELMYALDIMVGDGKNFNPEDTVTRAEMAKMVYVILNYGDDDKAVTYTGGKFFSDVPAGIWYEGYVNYAAATKLVQGRPDGTFGPMDPVTTAEAAKMLLTAIGYSAEARGYVGAKWADNVLSDAAIIGLLDGYKSNVNTYAPRQWVAVMFENALLDAYTFGTMAPSFSGLLTSGKDYDEDDLETMGEKYYGLNEFTKIAIATETAYIDNVKDKKDTVASEDCVLFSNGLEVKNTGLKVADLGQDYRVIYQKQSDGDLVAYSVRSVSETAEARTLDMEVDVKYATDSNKAYNKYEFTIGDMVATFEDYEVNVLFSGVNESATGEYVEVSVDDLRAMIKNDVNNNIWKAIDTDVDGKIDYFYVTEYDYAVVTDDDTHSRYGDYITAEDLSGADLEFNDEDRLYIEDCIITEDELADGDYVKYTWSLDDGQYVMEVLETAEDIEYTALDSKNGIHELDGADYMIADAADSEAKDVLVRGNLGENVDYVYDGDLIVYAELSDSNFTDMADVNAQLVLVLDVMDEYSNNKIREQRAIEYMTIDGETHIAAYQEVDDDDNDTTATYDDIDYAQWTELQRLKDEQSYGKYDADKADWQSGSYKIGGRLFILHEGRNGRVYLEKLSEAEDADGDAIVNVQLDASTSLLDGYAVKNNVALDTTGSAAKLDGDKIAAENVFFYGYFGTGGEAKYGVITSAELDAGVAKTDVDYKAYAQVLTLDNARGTRTTVVGGYIFANIESDTAEGYLFVDEILKETDDDYYRANVTLDDGTEKEILIDNALAESEYNEGWLYSYTYDVVDDYYTLTAKYVEDNNDEIVDVDEEYIITENSELEMDDEVIAIVRVQVDRDENRDEFDFERNPFEYDIVETKFVAVEDLTAEMIADGEDDEVDGYVQFTDYYHGDLDDGDEQLMYIVVWDVMDRYLGTDLTDSPLVCLMGQNVEEENANFTKSKAFLNAKKNADNEYTSSSMFFEMYKVAFAYSLDAVVYSEDGEVLTYATLDTSEVKPDTYNTLTCSIKLKAYEGSWITADWTPDAEEIPAYVEIIADGVKIGEAEVDLGKPDFNAELTAEAWAEIVANLAE